MTASTERANLLLIPLFNLNQPTLLQFVDYNASRGDQEENKISTRSTSPADPVTYPNVYMTYYLNERETVTASFASHMNS